MPKIDIAGLQIDAITKHEFFEELAQRMESAQKSVVTTLYSEFLLAARRDARIMELLNSADIALPDGVGILWARRFLSVPFTRDFPSYVEATWQMVYTGAQILLRPKTIYEEIPEKIVGADLIYDLIEFAVSHNKTVYLLGWYGQGTAKVKSILEQKFSGVQIVGNADANPIGLDSNLGKSYTKLNVEGYQQFPPDVDLVRDIQDSKPDMLLVAFGFLKQEAWIYKHLPQLPISMAIGLGGSFDYVLGRTVVPPKLVRKLGMEWLFRLITQPKRIPRILDATFGLIVMMIKYKVRNFKNIENKA